MKRATLSLACASIRAIHIRASLVAAALLFLSTQTFAQHLSYGVAAGTALTPDFSTYYFAILQGQIDVVRSVGKGVIIGPILEWSFSPYSSLESDALFRELRFEDLYAGNHNPFGNRVAIGANADARFTGLIQSCISTFRSDKGKR